MLLTGANGYLGRFLCLEWLERVAQRGGTLVCVVRGSSAETARARLRRPSTAATRNSWSATTSSPPGICT